MGQQSNVDIDTQRQEMRAELEALKQKVLDELKQKSAQLEQEADDLE